MDFTKTEAFADPVSRAVVRVPTEMLVPRVPMDIRETTLRENVIVNPDGIPHITR